MLSAQVTKISLRWYGKIVDYDYWTKNDIKEYDKSEACSLMPGDIREIYWKDKSDEIEFSFQPCLTISLPKDQNNKSIAIEGNLKLSNKKKTLATQPFSLILKEGETSSLILVGDGKNFADIRFQLAEVIENVIASERLVEYKDQYDPNLKLYMGKCRVSIPKRHKKGKMEGVAWYDFLSKEKPSEDLMVLDIKSMTEKQFYAQLKHTLGKAQQKDILIYVHGYQTSFVDAVRRAAQLSYDASFLGNTIVYSWPSYANSLDYTKDEESVALATENFKKFLIDLSQSKIAEKIHIVAYSMGNRLIFQSLFELAQKPDICKSLNLGQVIFTAADINAKIFELRFPSIGNLAQHYTLYCSSQDKALKVSQSIHGFNRVGEVVDTIPTTILPKLDTIDISKTDTSFFGHDYHASNTAVLDDIGELLRTGNKIYDRITDFQAYKKESLRYFQMLKKRGLGEERVENKYEIIELYYATDREEIQKK